MAFVPIIYQDGSSLLHELHVNFSNTAKTIDFFDEQSVKLSLLFSGCPEKLHRVNVSAQLFLSVVGVAVGLKPAAARR